jgi:1,2-phenylacetyl-CoA epoxidase PaaB subunit
VRAGCHCFHASSRDHSAPIALHEAIETSFLFSPEGAEIKSVWTKATRGVSASTPVNLGATHEMKRSALTEIFHLRGRKIHSKRFNFLNDYVKFRFVTEF